MNETMWKVLDILRQLYLERGPGGYLTDWQIGDQLGIKLAGCGVPDGVSKGHSQGSPAIKTLVKMDLIEQVPDLRCRYRIVVRNGEQ